MAVLGRYFLMMMGVCSAVTLLAASAVAAEENATAADKVKRFDTYRELPITSITPQGWLRTFLQYQRDGLTGHLEAGGHPFTTKGWVGPYPEGGGDHGIYASFGQWLGGMTRCGYLLRDDFLIQKARRHFDYALDHPADNGILGPNWNNWTLVGPRHNGGWRYAQYHFFNGLMAEYEVTRDERILHAMQQHYLRVPPAQHAIHQGVGNIEAMCWLYGQTGDRRMLDLAFAAWEHVNDPAIAHYRNFDLPLEVLLSDKKATEHGLTYMDGIRAPMLLYMYTGEQRLLDAALNGFRKVDRDHMLIDGCPSSNECLAGKNPRVLHETCVVPAFTRCAGYLLMITGETEWADKIERIIFNAGIGSVTKDFRTLQYYSSPNQVIATSTSSHNHQAGRERMQYRPGHATQCCAPSVNRFMPFYVARMWLADLSGGLVAATYGPSKITAAVGDDGHEVTIVERTDYPFSEKIEFEIECDQKTRFPLSLRIPGWCEEASISINGEPVDVETKAGTFVRLDRQFAPGDKIVLNLPMKLKQSFWAEGGIGIERGPLVYSLLITEDRQVDTESVLNTWGNVTSPVEEFPLWNIRPASPWNYALDVSYGREEFEQEVEIIHQPMVENPWAIGASPVSLRVPARRLTDWQLEDGLRTPRLPSPVEPSEEVERITLVPLGSTCIRLTVFPDCRYKWGRGACDRFCNEDGT